MCEYTAKDFKKGQPRWCPGCGDHFFLASLHKAMAEIGVPPYKTAVISGIGCSSRLPHYMNTYGMNTIHGRAAAIATGCKVANPELTVWQVSGRRRRTRHRRQPLYPCQPPQHQPEHDSAEQPYLRPDERTILPDVSPRFRQQIISLRYGRRPVPSGRTLLRCTRPLLCTRRCHGCSRNGGNPESRLQPQRSQRLRDSPELRHLQ